MSIFEFKYNFIMNVPVCIMNLQRDTGIHVFMDTIDGDRMIFLKFSHLQNMSCDPYLDAFN